MNLKFRSEQKLNLVIESRIQDVCGREIPAIVSMKMEKALAVPIKDSIRKETHRKIHGELPSLLKEDDSHQMIHK